MSHTSQFYPRINHLNIKAKYTVQKGNKRNEREKNLFHIDSFITRASQYFQDAQEAAQKQIFLFAIKSPHQT